MSNIKKLKVILVFAAILIVLVIYIGCEQTPKEEPQDAPLQINPVSEAVGKDKTSTRLYFGYSYGTAIEKLLVGEIRKIDVPVNESAEPSIINELIMGPSATRVDFVPLINPATKVINVEAQGQYLFVTLSSDFLKPLSEQAEQESEESASNEKTRKYLAVYSIVNTIVEQGTYSRVIILVDENGVARRLTQQEAGLESEDMAEPFERNGEIELNGRNTMREILTAIEKKDWSRLYGYIAYKNAYGQDKPSQEEFINEVVAAKLSLSNHEVIDSVSASDGLTDVIMINYDLKLQDGEPRTLANIPVRLTQENDVWKMSYNVFRTKFLT